MQEKKELRREMLAARDTLDPVAKQTYDTTICFKIEQLVTTRNAKTIHAYLPMGSEINIFPLLAEMLASGITIATPRALRGRKMENIILRSLSELEDGIYGTRHPANSIVYEGYYDLFIVPGLAFDKQNFRLGYGAGYYDTFFDQHPSGYKLGICYPFQLIDHVPVEPHDVPLDEVFFL